MKQQINLKSQEYKLREPSCHKFININIY